MLLVPVHFVSSLFSNYTSYERVLDRNIFSLIVSSMIVVLPGSIILSWIFLFFHILRKPGNRLLSMVLPLATSIFLLAGGLIVFSGLNPADDSGPQVLSALIREKAVNSIGEDALYCDSVIGNSIENAVIATRGNDERILHHTRIATGDVGSREFVIRFSDRIRYTITDEPASLYRHTIDPDFFSEELLSSYEVLASGLAARAKRPGSDFIVFILAFLFFIMTSGVFLRITKWPLFNVILYFFIISGMFFLYNIYSTLIAPELGSLSAGAPEPGTIPVMVFFITGIILFFIDIIFIPFNSPGKDTESG